MEKKIRFKDLSGCLKTVIVFGWIMFGLYALIMFIELILIIIGMW